MISGFAGSGERTPLSWLPQHALRCYRQQSVLLGRAQGSPSHRNHQDCASILSDVEYEEVAIPGLPWPCFGRGHLRSPSPPTEERETKWCGGSGGGKARKIPSLSEPWSNRTCMGQKVSLLRCEAPSFFSQLDSPAAPPSSSAFESSLRHSQSTISAQSCVQTSAR
jgi:hypothetical protein